MKVKPSFMSLHIKPRNLGFGWLLLFLMAGYSLGHGQTINSVNPNSTTAGQSITMVIGGSGTNFLAATGCYLRHSTSMTTYYGTSFSASSATNATVNFTLPPNATLGNYNLHGYNNFNTLLNAFNVGVGSGSAYGMVSGKVIIDNNSNCVENVGIDNPAVGAIVKLMPGPYYITTAANGTYSAWIPNGTYTASTTTPVPCGSLMCPGGGTHPVNITTPMSTDANNDFYWIPGGACSDLRANLNIGAGVFRPGFNTTMDVYFRNDGPSTVSNARGYLVKDPHQNLVNSFPNPSSTNGDTLFWNYSSMASGSVHTVTLILYTPTFVPLNTGFFYRCGLPPIGTDPNLVNNYQGAAYNLVGSFDPNDKQVWDAAGNIAEGPIAPTTTRLRYLIRCQNTGTYLAENIVIKDTLDTRLNAGSITITGSSHPMTFSLSGSRNVQFTFANIMLPDSFSNEPGSHGWVSYEVDLNPGVPVGSTIRNRASIYFDFNVPVLTNYTNSTLCSLLVGNFNASNVGNAFTFTDATTGGATSWQWDFGDGGTSTAQSPTHTYTASGSYVVCLTASNGCRSTTYCDTIATCQSPVPAFNSSVNVATVNFTDQSHASTTGWAWTFGDGGTSTAQNPSHTYATNGTYNVCLTSTNSCTSLSTCHTVTVCRNLNQSFTETVAATTVNFQGSADASATSWAWTFGDGGTSTAQNPSHTYATNGTYNVCLTVSSGCSTATTCHSVTVCRALNQAFTETIAAATVNFQGQADVSATSWAWTFGDGGTSTAQNPSHTYAANGTYNVCLTVTSGCSTATTCHSVTVCRMLNQAFTQNIAGASVTFQDQSDVSATSWAWTFGDGGTATAQNPSHTYATNGTYNVCLTVSSGCSTATTCHAVTVCRALNQTFTETVAATTVNFQGQADASATSWAWTFGDGGTSTVQNPSHTYAANGSYNVCLTVSSGCSTATTCHAVTVCRSLNQAFTQTVNGGTATFQDQSDVSATSWAWTFGDGGTSTLQNPLHTYATNGSFNVCLTVSSGCSTATTCHAVTVCRDLNEAFGQTVTGNSVAFQDLSDVTATTWAWDFGDGNSSTAQNPSHTYTAGGTYTVCLTVSSGCNTATTCHTVTTCAALNEAFTQTVSGGAANFQDLSGVSATGWSWNFGDGGTSTLQHPSHTYAANGTYTVCLTVSSGCAVATVCHTVTICRALNAGFNATAAGLGVSFQDLSDITATTWAWDFGDGNTSIAQNPNHTYAAAGTYNVCLVVSSNCDNETVCIPVTACTPLNENFSHSITGMSVNFTDLSDLSATTWAWDFGDGATSTLQNPVHAYTAAGVYTACLTVSNGCYEATICMPVDLCVATNPAIGFNMGPGLNVDFTGTADPSVNSWTWDFGDGATSTLQNPSHAYPGNGSYNVCLVVANACSTDVTCTLLSLVGMEEVQAMTIQVSPNPSTGLFTWQLDAPTAGELEMHVYDAKGALVSAQRVQLAGGLHKDQIDLTTQPSGLYLVQFELDGHSHQVKLLKQ